MDVKEILKDTVNIGEVVDRLGGLNLDKTGGGLLGPCPTGHASKGNKCFGVNLREGFFNCFNCGEAGDIFSLVMLVNRVDFPGALRWIAQEFRPELLPQLDQYKGETIPAIKEYYQRASIYDLVYRYGKQLLYEPAGQEALAYLVNDRGYTLENLKQTEWIYYPPEKELRAYILKQQPEAKAELGKISLQGHFGDQFRAAFPYRDKRGSITGFVKRALAPKGIEITDQKTGEITSHRWDSTAGLSKADLFNLYSCRRQETLIVVEGYPDALYFNTLGLKNVVAVGQGLLAKSHLEGLKAFNVKRVILALDNEETGLKNTEAALDLLKGTGIEAFIVDPPSLGKYKDPDELVKGEGIAAFKDLADNAQAAAKWKARRLLSKHPATDLGRSQVLAEAFAYTDTLQDPIEGLDFIDTIAEGLGLTREDIAPRLEDYQRRQAQAQEDKAIKQLLTQAEALRQQGKTSETRDLLKAGLQNLPGQPVSLEALKHYTLRDLAQDIRETPAGLKTGYDSLDQLLTIPPEAITIIAGRPSHGKTTLLLNFLVNMAKQYPAKTFLFFSYEETRKQLGVKLLNILSGEVINEAQNVVNLENYLRGGNTSRPRIEEGKRQLEELTSGGRIWLIDESLFVEDLGAYINSIASRHDLGAVFVDYIQKVKTRGKYYSRQTELQGISGSLLDLAKYDLKIPVILGAQLSRDKDRKDKVRLDNLRESGDIEQDANLVIGLFNPAMEKALDEGEKLEDRKVKLDLTILKQRNGAVNETVNLTFDRPILTITDNPPGIYDDISRPAGHDPAPYKPRNGKRG